MLLYRWIISAITDDRIHWRISGMAPSFFLVYYLSLLGGYFLLPEGVFRGKHPIISRLEFSSDAFTIALQIFVYNLIPSVLIIAANLIAQPSRVVEDRFVPVGYTAFWGLTAVFGIVTGTWSFDLATTAPPLGARITRLFDIAHRAGLLEFSGYLLIAVTTFRSTLWYSDRRRIVRSRSWREIELLAAEKLLLALGFVVLFIAALVESRAILQLAG